MRYRPIVFALLAAGSSLSSSQAQTGDWLAVQAIPPGSYISVKTQRYSVRCFFLTATDTQLLCDEHSLRKYPSGDPVVSDVNLDRQGISQVRLEHPTRSAFLGAVICSAIGAGIASALANGPKPDPEAQVYYPIFLGLSQDISEARLRAVSRFCMEKLCIGAKCATCDSSLNNRSCYANGCVMKAS